MDSKIKMRVVFRNVFEEVKIPTVISLVNDKGHNGVIFTMNKPKVLRGRDITVQGTKEELKQAMNFWKEIYGEELYTDL